MPTVGQLTSSFADRMVGNATGLIRVCQRNFMTSLPRWGRRCDTVQCPAVAKNFDCLPEQLLEELRNLAI